MIPGADDLEAIREEDLPPVQRILPYVFWSLVIVAMVVGAVVHDEPAAPIAYALFPWTLWGALQIAPRAARRRLRRARHWTHRGWRRDVWRVRNCGHLGVLFLRVAVAWTVVGAVWLPLHLLLRP